MKSLSILLQASVVLSVFLLSTDVFAQTGGGRIERPLNNPTFSPYINMLRNNGSPGLNYFGLVRPQLEAVEQNQQFGQNLQALQMQQNQPMRMMNAGYGYSQLGITGHPVVFNSFNGGQFGGGYTGMAGGGGFGGGAGAGGFGAGGFGQQGAGMGMNGGMNQFGGQGMLAPGGAGFGFSGVSGHPAQFGGIGASGGAAARGR